MRLPDWQSRLHDYLLSHVETKFQYGSLDCGLFTADVVHALTGIDPAIDLRGKYSSRRDAFSAVKAVCGTATMAAIATYLADKCGMQEIPVAFAQRGDAVLIGSGAKSHLGIISMHGTHIVAPGKTGLVYLSKSQATKAWRIQ